MNDHTVQNRINLTSQWRLRRNFKHRKKNAVPEFLNNRIARCVDNGSLILLIQIIEQTAVPLFVETPSDAGFTQLKDDDPRIPLWKDQTDSSWVITEPSICGEDHLLELFDGSGLLLGKFSSDYDNKICWGQLLDGLPSIGDSL